MLRIAYALSVMSLITASVVTAGDLDTRKERLGARAEFMILASAPH